MTIQSTIGSLKSPSAFVQKLMTSLASSTANTPLIERVVQLALKVIDVQARHKSGVNAIDETLQALNGAMVRLTAMKSELRERVLLDMASRQQLTHYRDDGTVQVLDLNDGRHQTYSNIGDVVSRCEGESSLNEPVILQFSPGQLVLTSDFRLGRVLVETNEDIYELDLGNGKHQAYSARDLVQLDDADGNALIFH